MLSKTILFSIILSGILLVVFILFLARSNRKKSSTGPGQLNRLGVLNSKLFRIITDFIRLNLAIVPVLLVLRAGQYFSLAALHSLPQDILLLEWHGLLHDLVIWQILSWALFLPFILLSLAKRWVGIFLFGFVFFFYTLSEWTLFQYFKVVLTPLDQVIFSYSVKEMIMITGNCVKINFLTFLPFIILFLLTLGLTLISLKFRLSKYVLIVFCATSAGFILFRAALNPKEDESRNPFEYFLTVNKSAYLAGKFVVYFSESKQSATNGMVEAATKRYHATHPEFNFLGSHYPFLHYDNTQDVLSTFFDLKKEKPNLVFIICESLSSCFSGNNNIFGSFTPFLDSLAEQSLYWSNFLSTADRTFNVLPAIFGSLPPGDATFVTAENALKTPYHLSLIRYFRENGYYTSFFYGGDPSFNNMERFLMFQGTDYILKTFGPKYQKNSVNENFGWGYSDFDLFNRSFEVMDSVKKSPRLDIYLTLSLHTPFIVPNHAYYLSQVDERMKKGRLNDTRRADIENYKNIFATILYTDQALKGFMDQYRKRPEFKNTIFIITGDHGIPELNLYRFSYIERFHVPLIIYSPMLKKRRPTFYSVSSHLDITPTVLAMLHRHYGLEISSVAPWLGTGIDTNNTFRNIHILPFILNSKEIPEYLNHMNYLHPRELSMLLPGLFLKGIIDPKARSGLNQELEDFKILNIYTARQNKLIPPEMYFGKVLYSDTVKLKDSLTINPYEPTGEWKTLFDKIPLNSKFKLIKLEVSVDFMTSKTFSGKIPLVVFDLRGKNGTRILWQSFEFPPDSVKAAMPGKWKTARIEETIDLSYLHETDPYSLILYIWNRDHFINCLVKPMVKIIGFF
jgi:phosphoglycerol transferase MdoB-like AlkP superfamily enzyme